MAMKLTRKRALSNIFYISYCKRGSEIRAPSKKSYNLQAFNSFHNSIYSYAEMLI